MRSFKVRDNKARRPGCMGNNGFAAGSQIPKEGSFMSDNKVSKLVTRL